MERRWMQAAFQIQTLKIGVWILARMNRRLRDFPSFAAGETETSAFGDGAGRPRWIESNKASTWNNYLNAAPSSSVTQSFCHGPLGSHWDVHDRLLRQVEIHNNTSDNWEQANSSVICLQQGRASVRHVPSRSLPYAPQPVGAVALPGARGRGNSEQARGHQGLVVWSNQGKSPPEPCWLVGLRRFGSWPEEMSRYTRLKWVSSLYLQGRVGAPSPPPHPSRSLVRWLRHLFWCKLNACAQPGHFLREARLCPTGRRPRGPRPRGKPGADLRDSLALVLAGKDSHPITSYHLEKVNKREVWASPHRLLPSGRGISKIIPWTHDSVSLFCQSQRWILEREDTVLHRILEPFDWLLNTAQSSSQNQAKWIHWGSRVPFTAQFCWCCNCLVLIYALMKSNISSSS